MEVSSAAIRLHLSAKEVTIGKSVVAFIRSTNSLTNRKKRGVRTLSIFKKILVVEGNFTVPQTDTGVQVE